MYDAPPWRLLPAPPARGLRFAIVFSRGVLVGIGLRSGALDKERRAPTSSSLVGNTMNIVRHVDHCSLVCATLTSWSMATPHHGVSKPDSRGSCRLSGALASRNHRWPRPRHRP